MPDWLELDGPTPDHLGLGWRFTVRTDRPGRLFTSLAFECDAGAGTLQIDLTVRDGQPALGDVAFCGSPFDGHTSTAAVATLVRTLDALPARVHCVERPSHLSALRPRALLLHMTGLLGLTPDDVAAVERLAETGTAVAVLAGECCRGTTDAANRVLTPFGLRMKQDGRDEPGIGREERIRRLHDWHDRYDSTPFVSGPAEVCPHPLTMGVRRVHWFRPTPVECVGPLARPLIGSPSYEGECFAAVSEAKGYVVAVGTPLWLLLSTVVWPYDNDRLLANLLVGGDAEAIS